MTGDPNSPDASAPPDVLGAQLERSIRDIGIPPRPTILDRIATEMQKDEPDFRRLTTIISADVSLAAGLIKTANSPYFGTRRRVRSIQEALIVLGLNVASQALAGIILRKVFPPSPALVRFWDSSARVARISGWLSEAIDRRKLRPEDAYTFGLFRDCGIPILMRRFPDYLQILAEANADRERCFTDVEIARLPTSHAMVGCLLAQSWWLPEELSLAIRHHHSLPALTDAVLPAQTRRLIATAQLAEHILQRHARLSMTQEWAKLGDACLEILEIGPDRFDSLVADAAEVASLTD